MPERFHEPILSYLSSQSEAVNAAEMAERLNISEEDRPAFDRAIDQLAGVQRIVVGAGRSLTLPAIGNKVIGTYRQTSRGFGFVIPSEPNAHGDLFIPVGENRDAVTGDIVVAKVVVRDKYESRDSRKAVSGRIIEIVKRGTNRAVGTLSRQNNRWLVTPDGNIFKAVIEVRDVTAKSAKEGDKVVVELLQFPYADQVAQGVITEVLGVRGEPEVELQSVVWQYDLPRKFPNEVLEQARQVAITYDPAEYGEREDLSEQTIVTIDPDDARDFDDAISIKRLRRVPNGAESQAGETGEAVWELGVHIADVSAFVPVESALDMEARARGNSTYFPRYVIPMLPEILSNGVCSLQEAQPRLTKSAFIRYDGAGNVVGSRFANTLIRSRKRLTYKQAQAVIDDAKGEGEPYSKGLLESPPNPNVPVVAEDVRQLLVEMDRLARAIRQRRLAAGMIVLDLPEVELVMDDEGRVIDARPEDDSFTHKIIEMFMVEANEAVARFLTKHKIPVLRRTHADPDTLSAEQMRQFVTVAGRKVPKVLDRHAIQELVDSVRGTPISYAVHLAVLKTFTTAEYSPLDMGHYALASENYAHFTSPIRRYADLVIHRCLNAILLQKSAASGHKPQGKKKKKLEPRKSFEEQKSGLAGQARGIGLMPTKLGEVPDYDTLVQLGKHLSYTERRSQDAERELRTVKVLQLLAEHVGDVIDGIVTGVTGFGVFVQSTRFLIEGLIRTADLPDDFWQYDERIGVLRGQRSGRRIAPGDLARVQIVSVHIPARQLDFRILEHGSTLSGETHMRRVEPRQQPKPLPVKGDDELERPYPPRKKNLSKREERKEAARLAAQRRGGRDGSERGGRGRGKNRKDGGKAGGNKRRFRKR